MERTRRPDNVAGARRCVEDIRGGAVGRVLVFFFFQAEDGIRDLTVTGVQTCALPILNSVFTLGLLVGLSVYDTTYGTTLGNLGWEEVRFPKPVLIGDTLRAATTEIGRASCRERV